MLSFPSLVVIETKPRAQKLVLAHLQTYYQTGRTANGSLAHPVTVGERGAVKVTLQYGDPIVLFPQSKVLKGQCGFRYWIHTNQRLKSPGNRYSSET